MADRKFWISGKESMYEVVVHMLNDAPTTAAEDEISELTRVMEQAVQDKAFPSVH